MLTIGSHLLDKPVLGLHTGGEIARTKSSIINPNNLSIIAYQVSSYLLDRKPYFLRVEDIREISNIGLIIDSSDEFVTLGAVVKLDEIYNLNFKLIGSSVFDQSLKKLGKISDFTLDIPQFKITQLTVKRPLFKSLTDSELLIHRSKIVEINNDRIIIKSESETNTRLVEAVDQPYFNPFRKEPATE